MFYIFTEHKHPSSFSSSTSTPKLDTGLTLSNAISTNNSGESLTYKENIRFVWSTTPLVYILQLYLHLFRYFLGANAPVTWVAGEYILYSNLLKHESFLMIDDVLQTNISRQQDDDMSSTGREGKYYMVHKFWYLFIKVIFRTILIYSLTI